jgi:hypothetical protein
MSLLGLGRVKTLCREDLELIWVVTSAVVSGFCYAWIAAISG